MTSESGDNDQEPPPETHIDYRSYVAKVAVIVLVILTIIIILAFTVFKPKNPTTIILSSTINGVSPRVHLSQLKVELNITLNLEILVHNPNKASFKHATTGGAASLVYYYNTQVAVAEIPPGTIPADGYETIDSTLTLQADQFLCKINELVNDIAGGEIELETKATVPGQVEVLWIFHKHVVSVSHCRIVIAISDLKIRRQECDYRIKF